MTAHHYLYLIAMVLTVMGWGTSVYGEDDVTVISTPTASTTPKKKTDASDGTPVVHKSLHKKKHTETETASGANTAPAPVSSPAAVENKPVKEQPPKIVVIAAHPQSPAANPPAQPPAVAIKPVQPLPVPPAQVHLPIASTTPVHPIASAPVHAPTVAAAPTQPQSIAPTNAASVKSPPIVVAPANPAATGLTVETGLPVARYPGMGSPIRGVSTYSPIPVPMPSVKSVAGATTHQTYLASVLPAAVIPMTSSAAGSYSPPSRTTSPPSDFVFTNFSKKTKATYPWKTGVITTMFWIGEGDTPISRTTNEASSWDEDWLPKNHGTDSPYNRNGYASGNHASMLNPFYVALPFNDLAFPDKARRWVPSGWTKRPKDGKQVSACKDRWVEIKNQRGDYCYAQWEDVGPLRYDHAEYVFGGERPIGLGDNHAGLDVSPAVAQYLGIDGKNRITSWRFVDDEDVRPGAWLKLDEQAVLYTALHQLKNAKPSAVLPIQRASEPVEDASNSDSNKKKVDASKG